METKIENKIIKACQKYDDCSHPANGELTDDDIEYIHYFCFELAKSILEETCNEFAKRLAIVLLGFTDYKI